jgi:hypothetical protein
MDYAHFKSRAIKGLVGGPFHMTADFGIEYLGGQSPPTDSEIQAKVAELEAAEPMRVLREERNLRLKQTDWWASSDLVMSNGRKIYRQQLRDLPATASPTLDESGQLSGVEWPGIPD